MKKGLLALFAAVTLCASSVFANAPVVTELPDVTIGDQEDNTGTDNNFFVFTNAFEFRQFVNDADDDEALLKWSFDEGVSPAGTNAGRWFQINGKDALHNAGEAVADDPDNAPHLNPGANELNVGSNGFATFRDIIFSPTSGSKPFGNPTEDHSAGKVVTFFVADNTTVTAAAPIIVNTIDNGYDAISGGTGFKLWWRDEFTTQGTWIYTGDSPSSTIGRGVDHDYIAGQAMRLRTYTAGTDSSGNSVRTRQGGWTTDAGSSPNDVMPYTVIGSDNYARAKYYVYTAGQANPAAKNQIPTLSLRLASGFALTANLIVQGHNNGLSSGDAIRDDIVPSANAATPSVYRVDYDPPDVPAMQANPLAVGLHRAIYITSGDAQENGDLVLEQSDIGYYPVSLVPDSGGTVIKTFSGTGLGSTTNGADQWDEFTHSFPPPVYEGSPGASSPGDSQEPVITVNASGLNINSTPTPASKIGIAQHYVDLGTNGAVMPRVQPNKLYKLRFHLTSTANANTQTSFWLYSQTVDFAYINELEFGGTRLFTGGLTNVHNLTAAQLSPGNGTSWTSGMYNVMLNTPLDPEIRADVAGDLATKMPQLNAQPGPGDPTALSFKSIQPGMIMIDTLNAANAPDSDVEVGNVTLDNLEIREYDQVVD